MMNTTTYLVPFLFFCTSCAMTQQGMAESAFLTSEDRKQRQKMIVLQKKLSQGEQILLKNQEEVQLLRAKLCEAQLEVIETAIEQIERKWQLNPVSLIALLQQEPRDLFFEERETLHEILQSGFFLHRAQGLLDRILQLITQMNDSKY